MSFIAYNTVKRAYLAMDASKKWTLTTDINKAHRSDSSERLKNITKMQARLIPDAWRIDDVLPATPVKEEESVEQKPEEIALEDAAKEEIIEMIHNKDNPVCGKWIASNEYKAVLNAMNVLKQFATQDYATKLREELSKLNEEIVDVEHYIELTPMNMPRAYKAATHIKEVMQKRRDIRQQILLINRIYDNRTTESLLSAEWEQPQDEVEKMYTPRTPYGERMPWKDLA